MMNGDSEVIGLSSLLEITKNLAKFSLALNVKVVGCVSSSGVERQKSFSRSHGDEIFYSIAMRPSLHGTLQGDV